MISTQPTEGADPCYVSFDPGERHALLTNYTGGNFVALEIDGSGTLGLARSYRQIGSGPMASRQEGPHPHMIAPNPVDGQIYVSDLGIDQVVAYVFDPESGDLVPPAGAIKAVLKPGAGPRHFVFDETGNRLYVIGELDSTITFFERKATGENWNAVQSISTLPADFRSESTCAQILRSADGRFLYGSNRGHDSIAIFGIDQASGRLTALGHESTRGTTPRNFNIDPTGAWLFAANQDSDTVVLFRRDADSGRLTVSGDPISRADADVRRFRRRVTLRRSRRPEPRTRNRPRNRPRPPAGRRPSRHRCRRPSGWWRRPGVGVPGYGTTRSASQIAARARASRRLGVVCDAPAMASGSSRVNPWRWRKRRCRRSPVIRRMI